MPWLFRNAPKRLSKIPRQFTLENHRYRLPLLFLQSLQNISRIHWEHFAASVSRVQ